MKRILIIRLALLIVCALSFDVAFAQDVRQKPVVKKQTTTTTKKQTSTTKKPAATTSKKPTVKKQTATKSEKFVKVESNVKFDDAPSSVAAIASPNNIMVQETTPNNEDDKIFDIVEQMPSFPGGLSALQTWLASNITYPAQAVENGIQGRVIVAFIVERDGTIMNVRVTKSVAPSLDKEAVRVVKSMPKWIPGTQNGEPVRVKYCVPVVFNRPKPKSD